MQLQSLYDSYLNREFIKYENEFSETTNDINNIINNNLTKCKLIKKEINLTDEIVINSDYFNVVYECNYIAFHSIKIKRPDAKYIKNLMITIGGSVIWSLDFNFLMAVSKYKNDTLYFPNDLLFESNIFFPLISMQYHNIRIYFIVTDEYKTGNNVISCQFNFIGMTNCLNSQLSQKFFKMHEYCDNYGFARIKDFKFAYPLNFLSTKCVYVKAKNLSSAKLNLIDLNTEIECIITRLKEKDYLNYKTIFMLKIPFDIIKIIFSYLLDHDDLYLIQFNENNTYLELQTINRAELVLNVEAELIIGVQRNILGIMQGMAGKCFVS